MNVAVCVKQIPDTTEAPELDPEDYTLVRAGKLVMDDSDSYGVEMGLQLVEAAGGGEVSLVSMAPERGGWGAAQRARDRCRQGGLGIRSAA
jgi:electron transfer flavoprotein beta subunit